MQRYRDREWRPEKQRPPEKEKEKQWGRAEEIKEIREELIKEGEAISQEFDKVRKRIKKHKEQIDKDCEELIRNLRIAAGEIESPVVKEKPSFPTMEEWLKEAVVDPSFFMLKPRSDRLLDLLKGLEVATVIVPTDFYNMLNARYKESEAIENIDKEEYYPSLLDIIRRWEIAITEERKGEILNWISSSDFWTLLSKFFKLHVVTAGEYLGGEFRTNPIDIQHTIKVLGKTTGRAFYEMIAVSEKTGRAIISATYGFVRLCRRVKIPTYESYTKWKNDFRQRYGFRGNFFIIVALATGGALEFVLRKYVPAPIIPEVTSGYITIKIYDG